MEDELEIHELMEDEDPIQEMSKDEYHKQDTNIILKQSDEKVE